MVAGVRGLGRGIPVRDDWAPALGGGRDRLGVDRLPAPGQYACRRGPRRTSADRPQPGLPRRQRDSCSRVAVLVRPSRAGLLGKPARRRGRRPDDSQPKPQAPGACTRGEDRRIVRRSPPARPSQARGQRAGSRLATAQVVVGEDPGDSDQLRRSGHDVRGSCDRPTGPGRGSSTSLRERPVPRTSGSCPSPGRSRSARRTGVVPTGRSCGRSSRRSPAWPVNCGCGPCWDPCTP